MEEVVPSMALIFCGLGSQPFTSWQLQLHLQSMSVTFQLKGWYETILETLDVKFRDTLGEKSSNFPSSCMLLVLLESS